MAAGIALARSPRLTAALLAGVVALSAFGAVGEIRYSRTQTESVVTEIAADIEANDVEQAVVVACPDQLGVALQRQLDQQLGDGTEVIPYPAAGDPRFVDWVDYGERNAASDPVAVRRGSRRPTPPAGHAVRRVQHHVPDLRGQVRGAHRGAQRRARRRGDDPERAG